MEEKNFHSKLQYIDEAYWLKTLEHYPETVEHFHILISIIDKIGIFKKFDLQLLVDMNGDKLNILYAILRITNKIFNKYLDYVVKKIFKFHFQKIFVCTHSKYYTLFFDQFVQDIDDFICELIQTNYFTLDNDKVVLSNFLEYLKQTFQKDFYIDIAKKLSYCLDNNFFEKNKQTLSNIIQYFTAYTKETLVEVHVIMIGIVDKIFSNDCTPDIIEKIISGLVNNMNLPKLFNEQCMEIELYCEQRINNSEEISFHRVTHCTSLVMESIIY